MSVLLDQGLELAAIGMGTVFVFLSLLVVATRVMSMLILQFGPGESAADGADRSMSEGMNPMKVAAIAAAIAQYRKERG